MLKRESWHIHKPALVTLPGFFALKIQWNDFLSFLFSFPFFFSFFFSGSSHYIPGLPSPGKSVNLLSIKLSTVPAQLC